MGTLAPTSSHLNFIWLGEGGGVNRFHRDGCVRKQDTEGRLPETTDLTSGVLSSWQSMTQDEPSRRLIFCSCLPHHTNFTVWLRATSLQLGSETQAALFPTSLEKQMEGL